MESVLAIVIGVLFAVAVYLVLRRSLMKLILGLILLSQAANLLVFTSGGINRGQAPIVSAGGESLQGMYADPVPQALVLTAIVISFGVLAFTLVLVYRAHQSFGIEEYDQIKEE